MRIISVQNQQDKLALNFCNTRQILDSLLWMNGHVATHRANRGYRNVGILPAQNDRFSPVAQTGACLEDRT